MAVHATRTWNWIPAVTFTLPGSRARRARRRAVDLLALHYPDWHAKRFDAFFVRRIPRDWIASQDVEAIAREWTRQFIWSDERQRERDVRQVRAVAETYLVLLAAAEAELTASPSASGAHGAHARSI